MNNMEKTYLYVVKKFTQKYISKKKNYSKSKTKREEKKKYLF